MGIVVNASLAVFIIGLTYKHTSLGNEDDLLTLPSEIFTYSWLQFYIAQNSIKLCILYLIARNN